MPKEPERVACLSWKPEHTAGFVVAANPIYPVLDLSALASQGKRMRADEAAAGSPEV
jgi:hypothetical protein